MNTILLFFKNNRSFSLAIVAIVALLTVTQALAAAGSLDPTFGTNGMTITDLGSSSDSSTGVVLQLDGSILMMGSAQGQPSVLRRYNPDGSVDDRYGQAAIGFSACDFAIQPDGKVVVGGSTGRENITLRRSASNRSAPDYYFGTDGVATLSLGSDFQIWCKDIAIQPDQKIVVFGSEITAQSNHTDFFVARFNQDGSPDDTFVANGFNIIDKSSFPTSQFNYGQAAAIQPDGKIVLSGGMQDYEGNGQISLARLNADGSLDKTFGTNGKGTVIVALPFFYDHKSSMVLQADGKIVVAGTTYSNYSNPNENLALARFNNNGALDTTFGGTGIVITDFGAKEFGTDVHLQADGRIIVVGTSSASGSDNLLIARYNTDGSLDNTFGDNGKLVGGLGSGPSSGARIEIQPDGRAIVVGSSNGDTFVARYYIGGVAGPAVSVSLDPTFGANGMATADLGGSSDSGSDIVMQPDGKIVMLGSAKILMRYNSNGSLDNTFGTNGKLTLDFFGQRLAVQPDGKLLVAGGVGVARYNVNGTGLDTTFGTNGVVKLSASPSNLVVESNGRIVVVGTWSSQGNTVLSGITRLNSDGTPYNAGYGSVIWLDNVFSYANYNFGEAVAAQPDGKIVIFGRTMDGETYSERPYLVRLNQNGSLDKSTFGTNGSGAVIIAVPRFHYDKGSMVIQADGKIVVAGTVGDSDDVHNDLIVARFNTNGALDTTFGGTGIVVTDFGTNEFGTDVHPQVDGKIIVVGTSFVSDSSNLLIVRYNKDGSLDTTFGDNGKLVGGLGNGSSSGAKVEIQPDLRVLVAGSSNGDAFLARYNVSDTTGTSVTVNYGSAKSFDGFILESGENSNVGGAVDRNAITFNVGDDQRNRQYVGILSFNTSLIPDNALITSAQVKIKKQGVKGSDPMLTHGDLLLDIRKEFFGSSLALLAGDFAAPASLGSISGQFSNTADTWYTANLPATDLEFISKTLTTQFRVRFSLDDDNDRIADYLKFYSGNAAEANRPQLIVTYSTTGGTVNQAPVINGGATLSVSIPENTTVVTAVTAADPQGLPITYSISGLDAGKFSISSTTGILAFRTAPDAEAIPLGKVYHVTAKASDGILTASQDIAVTVTGVNEFAPVITSNGGKAVANISMRENTIDVTTITATDADMPPQTIEYTISGGADGQLFNLDESTGKLSFVTAPRYDAPDDADQDHVYHIIVGANDGEFYTTQELVISIINPNSARGFTALKVNAHGPTITSSNSISVSENNIAVTTVTATDDETPVQPLGYSITGGVDASRFSIDLSTGALAFVSAPDFEAPADANLDNIYDVTVQVSDGSLTVAQDIAVTVTAINDNNPVITSNSSLSIAENTTTVTTVAATDADLPAQTLTYSISGGPDAAHFNIDTATGVIAFATLPDFETPTDAGLDNIYNVTVQASDGTLTATQDIAVTVTAVNDNNPVITSANGISVPENTSVATAVTASDADLPTQTLTYSIAGGADAAYFNIDPATGMLAFASPPDFEVPTDAGLDNIYNVTVQASDGSLVGTQDLAVTVSSVNDNPPMMTAISALGMGFDIPENVSSVTTITATDADLPAQILSYSIIGGTDSALFSINSSTGELAFITAPDFEAPSDAGLDNIYNVTVQASDGTLVAVQDLVVAVAAVNDNTPVITSVNVYNVPENIPAVTVITASDTDLPAETLTYSIAGGPDSTLFNINSSTGELTFITPPDFEIPTDAGSDNIYNVAVQASDGTLSVTQDMLITVSEVNDNTPIITSVDKFSVPENTSSVTTITATDADLPAQILTYSIAGGSDATRFSIVSSTGILAFITPPDFEAPTDTGLDNTYNVIVRASDGTLSATKDLLVTVTPVNDNIPVITSLSGLNIPENTSIVTTVTASDIDLPAQALSFVIIEGLDSARFSINPSTGALVFISAPDFESPNDTGLDNIYNVKVQASDGAFVITQDIVVTITNVTD